MHTYTHTHTHTHTRTRTHTHIYTYLCAHIDAIRERLSIYGFEDLKIRAEIAGNKGRVNPAERLRFAQVFTFTLDSCTRPAHQISAIKSRIRFVHDQRIRSVQ